MTDNLHAFEPSGSSIPAVKEQGRRRWQIGLRTLFLLIAAIAVWMTYFLNRRDNASLEARIKAMVPLAHELIVDDPKRIAVVKLDEHWFDENRWEIYLPDGQYRLSLATRGISDAGLASVAKSTPIASGRHHLALEQRLDKDFWRISALWDGTELIAVDEPKVWNAGSGWIGGGEYSLSEQLPPDKPAVLYRRRFMGPSGNGQATSANASTEGILIWIERTAGTKAKP